ncbi:zinc finger protein 431-like [Galleria mellonella]|uniref:Zinc finger protein 431-like n=1 Tax=Galleria mellonella TaxID=7137 RepID=A0A6J1WNN8_GALME|nr:zinc finger protein 431-like [Galleria mellonella]
MPWFQMEEQPGLPKGICRGCTAHTIAAISFKDLCNTSKRLWNDAADYLSLIDGATDEDKAFYVFYNADRTLIRDQTERVSSKERAVQKLNTKFLTDKKKKPYAPRVKRSNGVVVPCRCSDCGKRFSDPVYMNLHLMNTSKRICTECYMIIPKTKLAQHLATAHGKWVHDCKICHKLFDTKDGLSQHVYEHHDDKGYPCKVCGISFANERALSAHMYSHSLFHCNTCRRSFENRKCYKYHLKQCSFPKESSQYTKQYICDYCNSSYTKKPSLRIHIIQKHLNVLPYICQICGKRTSTVAHLKSHQSVHTNVRKIYECYCGARLRTELGYNLHQRIHTGERPYECKECGEKFLSASRRLDHIKRRHRSTQEMPHGCDKCHARFVRPFELKKHYLSVHYAHIEVTPATRGVRKKY